MDDDKVYKKKLLHFMIGEVHSGAYFVLRAAFSVRSPKDGEARSTRNEERGTKMEDMSF